MDGGWRALLVASALAAGCWPRPSEEALTPARAADVARDVRTFMRGVAEDVTREGPSAWGRHFETGPSFFMVADGRLAFADGAAARAALPELVRTLPHIHLAWGEVVRVDALTQSLAAVATPYREALVNSAGQRTESAGFFTATAEKLDGHWHFRNAHWSEPLPPAGLP